MINGLMMLFKTTEAPEQKREVKLSPRQKVFIKRQKKSKMENEVKSQENA